MLVDPGADLPDWKYINIDKVNENELYFAKIALKIHVLHVIINYFENHKKLYGNSYYNTHTFIRYFLLYTK